MRRWHTDVLNVYRRQVLAARRTQVTAAAAQARATADAATAQAASGDSGGRCSKDAAAATVAAAAAADAAAAALAAVSLEDVPPSQFVNDGYIWLSLTHHLLGAGRPDQVHAGTIYDCGRLASAWLAF